MKCYINVFSKAEIEHVAPLYNEGQTLCYRCYVILCHGLFYVMLKINILIYVCITIYLYHMTLNHL